MKFTFLYILAVLKEENDICPLYNKVFLGLATLQLFVWVKTPI